MSRSFKVPALAVVLMVMALEGSTLAIPFSGPEELPRAEVRAAPSFPAAESCTGPLSQAAPAISSAKPAIGEQGSEPAVSPDEDLERSEAAPTAGNPAPCTLYPAPGTPCPAPPRSGPDVSPVSIRLLGPDPAIGKFGAAVVGMPSQLNVTILNSGTADAALVGLRLTISDYFSNIIGDYSTSIPSIAAGANTTVYWKYWTPAYSTQFSVNATVNAAGDTNRTNDTLLLKGQLVEKWLDACDAVDGWTGDTGAGEWELVTDIMGDKYPDQHSPYGAWHCGQDGRYLNGTDASLITPTLDLTRMNPNYYILFNFNYYGISIPGDQVDTYVTDDNGASWYPLLVRLEGNITDRWRDRVSHWQDYNGNNVVDDNEPHQDGLDISRFGGRTINIRFRFTSDSDFSEMGFYLDDFVLRGMENLNDVALLDIGARGLDKLGEEQTFTATVRNLGQSPAGPFKTWFNITPGETAFSQNAPSMSPGQTVELLWKWTPALPGNFTAHCTLLPQADEVVEDNSLWRPIHVAAGNASTLLVDDDSGPGNNGALRGFAGADVEWAVEEALTMAEYDVYLVGDEPGPPPELLRGYGLVVWVTGYDDADTSRAGTLTRQDRQNLSSYLDGGGRLWLISFEVMWDTWTVQGNVSFPTDYLRVRTFDEAQDDDVGMPSPLEGVPGDPITDTPDGPLLFDTAGPPLGLWDKCDRLENASDSPGIFFQYSLVKDKLGGPFNALRYSGRFKLVFMAFEFTFIRNADDRARLTSRVMDWLWGGTSLVAGTGGPDGHALPGGKIVYNISLVNSEQRSWTIESLGPGQLSAGWSASSEPTVFNGSPPLTLAPLGSTPVKLDVTAPADAPAGSVGNVTLLARMRGSPGYVSIMTRTIVLRVGGVNLSCAEPVVAAPPGHEALFMVSVTNEGNYDNTVNLSLRGEAAAWCQLLPSWLYLSGGGTAFVQVTADVPEEVLAGTHNLTVKAEMPDGTAALFAELPLTISVNATRNLKIEGSPAGATVNMAEALEARIIVEISNYGNVEETAIVSLCATFNGWQQWSLDTLSRDLQPFEKGRTVELEIVIPPTAAAGYYNLTVRLGYGSGDLADKRNTVVHLQRPDLSISVEDARTSPAKPGPSDNLELTAVVHNAGDAEARNVAVAFVLNDRSAGTARIADPIPPGLTATASVFYRGIRYGDNLLKITIDPDNSLLESSKDNNQVAIHVFGYQADLAPGAVSLRAVGRAQPADNRTVSEGMVEISVLVLNSGSYCLDVENVDVNFTVDGAPVETRLVSVGANSETTATALWFAKKGSHVLRVGVDQGNSIDEVSKADNEASLTIKVQGMSAGAADLGEWLPLAAGVIAVALVGGVLAYESFHSRAARREPFAAEAMRRFRAKPGSSFKCDKCGKPVTGGSAYFKCGCGSRYHVGCAPEGACERCADGERLAEEE